jgi:hypothetical protein
MRTIILLGALASCTASAPLANTTAHVPSLDSHCITECVFHSDVCIEAALTATEGASCFATRDACIITCER